MHGGGGEMVRFDIPDTYEVSTEEETFFDTYKEEGGEEEDGELVITVSQEAVDRFMDLNEDYNEVHEVPGLGHAVAQYSSLLEEGKLNEDEAIVQGDMTVYEAIRQADDAVADVYAEFEAPINTGDTVVLDYEATEDGESLTTERPALADTYDDTTAATVDLSYAEEELQNAANAKKVVDTLGFADHSGHILVSVEAEQLGNGTGELDVSPGYNGEPGYKVVKDLGGPKISEFRYEFSDGTRVKNTVLELDEENYEEALDAFEDAPADTDGEDYNGTAPSPIAVWTETCNEMLEASNDLIETSNDVMIEAGNDVMETNIDMYQQGMENMIRASTAPFRAGFTVTPPYDTPSES